MSNSKSRFSSPLAIFSAKIFAIFALIQFGSPEVLANKFYLRHFKFEHFEPVKKAGKGFKSVDDLSPGVLKAERATRPEFAILREGFNKLEGSLDSYFKAKANDGVADTGLLRNPELTGTKASGESVGTSSGSHGLSKLLGEGSSGEKLAPNALAGKQKFDMVKAMFDLEGVPTTDAKITSIVDSLNGDFAFSAFLKSLQGMDAKTMKHVLAKMESPEYRKAYSNYLDKILGREDLLNDADGPKKIFELSSKVLENYDLASIKNLSNLREGVDSRLSALKTKEAKIAEAKKIVDGLKLRQKEIEKQIAIHEKSGGDPEKLKGAREAHQAISKSISDLESRAHDFAATDNPSHADAFDGELRQAIARDMLRGKLDTDDIIRDTLDSDYLIRVCGGAA